MIQENKKLYLFMLFICIFITFNMLGLATVISSYFLAFFYKKFNIILFSYFFRNENDVYYLIDALITNIIIIQLSIILFLSYYIYNLSNKNNEKNNKKII